MKSADSMSASLPAGAQCDRRMPISWPWKIGRPWWPLWVIRAMALPGQVVPEDLEGVEVGVGPEDVEIAAGDDLLHLGLDLLALGAHFGEPGGEDDGELGLGGHGVTEDGERLADQDGHQVELLGDVGQGLGAGPAVDFAAVGVDVVDGGPPLLAPDGDLLGQRRVRAGVGVRRPDHGHPLGAEERIEVDLAQGDRPARDVEHQSPSAACAVPGCLSLPSWYLPCPSLVRTAGPAVSGEHRAASVPGRAPGGGAAPPSPGAR